MHLHFSSLFEMEDLYTDEPLWSPLSQSLKGVTLLYVVTAYKNAVQHTRDLIAPQTEYQRTDLVDKLLANP